MRPEPDRAARTPPCDPPALGALWSLYVGARDTAARDQLVAAYLGFARIMAAKLYARRVYSDMEFDDYLQYARIGLMEAIGRFEPERGIKFETFAAMRITGAILDGVASSSEIRQQLAARKRVVAARMASLGQSAAAADGAEAVFARLAEMAIGLALGFTLEDSGMYRGEEPGYADNGYQCLELKQLQARIRSLVDSLPAAQKQVIQWHYLQQRDFSEIASALQLTRGRVAQIHKEALGKLRAKLHNAGEVDLDC
jgi:RNA polymerase sigma factor for flagellar operon FliA